MKNVVRKLGTVIQTSGERKTTWLRAGLPHPALGGQRNVTAAPNRLTADDVLALIEGAYLSWAASLLLVIYSVFFVIYTNYLLGCLCTILVRNHWIYLPTDGNITLLKGKRPHAEKNLSKEKTAEGSTKP